jgi:hypothetical protein
MVEETSRSERDAAAVLREAPVSLRGLCVLLFHLALVAVAGTIIASHAANPEPEPSHRLAACDVVRSDDDVVHLALRGGDAAVEQLERSTACDSDYLDDVEMGVFIDFLLIALILIGLVTACVRARSQLRWRAAAHVALLLVAVYVVSDALENAAILRIVDTYPDVPLDERLIRALPWVAYVKFGALAGTLPIFLLSMSRSLRPWIPDVDPDVQRGLRTRSRTRREATRWWSPRRWWPWSAWKVTPSGAREFLGDRYLEEPDPKAFFPDRVDPPGHAVRRTGIAASGGGIRSAAFNLGALQALDVATVPGATPAERRTEYSNVDVVSAVSGGSYMATAWVNDHDRLEDLPPKPWGRRSREEQFLRRHAAYLAPGFSGKVWGATRLVLGLIVNLGFVGLVLVALSLPMGWFVEASQSTARVDGTIELEDGGCVLRTDGTPFVVLPGSELRLAGDADPHVDVSEAPDPPTEDGLTATVTIEQDGDELADASVTEGSAAISAAGASGQAAVPGPASGADADGVLRAPDRDDVERCFGLAAAATGSTGSTRSAIVERLLAIAAARRSSVAPGGRFESGTTFVLVLDRGLDVTGRQVTGCASTSECALGRYETRELRKGTRLVQASGPVRLEISGAATVFADGDVRRLGDACGTAACERVDDGRWFVSTGRIVTWVLVGTTAILGIFHLLARRQRTTAERFERWYKRLVGLTVAVVVVLLALPALVTRVENGYGGLEDDVRKLSGAGTLTIVLTLLTQLSAFSGSKGAPSTLVGRFTASVGPFARRVLLRLATYVAAPLTLLVLVLGITSWAAQRGMDPGAVGVAVGVAGVLAFILLGADLNQWSIHPFYRDRLCSAFAVPGRGEQGALLGDLPATPELIICGAANIADDRATPPGRPVLSWTFSRAAMGCAQLGWITAPASSDAIVPPTAGAGPGSSTRRTVPAPEPQHLPDRWRHLAEVWCAVAVSGAAFSPAMGKMTRPVRGLLALGNLRLGLWFPNPLRLAEQDGQTWYTLHHPRAWYLFKELVGSHRFDDRWVYVTDGGHYENLGLTELLERRCTEIFCFDASGDSTDTFGTLAEAMRIARARLDIEIDIDPSALRPDEDGISRVGVCAGTVRYAGDPEPSGWIVLAKLAVPETAPFDIRDLARTLPKFPNHPTSDQLYTDQKFEAYRALGHHLGVEAAALAADIRRLQSDGGKSLVDAVALANGMRVPAKEHVDAS